MMSSELTTAGQPRHGTGPVVPAGRATADLDLFWDGYKLTLRRYAWYLLDLRGIPDSRAEVDDIVSDVYLDLREAWPVVRSPIAYTRSRARVAVFNALRDEIHRGRPIGGADDRDDDELDVRDTGPTPEELVLDQQVDEALRAALPHALKELTPRQRAAVELTAGGERSRRQVATELDAAPGTISSHRTRGLVKLRHVLGPIVVVSFNAIGDAVYIVMHGKMPIWALVLCISIWMFFAAAIVKDLWRGPGSQQ
jgi:RNA polymerase sigma factor (sigma-70 family)